MAETENNTIKENMNQIRHKLEALSERITERYQEEKDNLKEEAHELLEKVTKAKKVAYEAREDAQVGLQLVMDDLNETYDSIKERFEKDFSDNNTSH